MNDNFNLNSDEQQSSYEEKSKHRHKSKSKSKSKSKRNSQSSCGSRDDCDDDGTSDIGSRMWATCRSDLNSIIGETRVVIKYVKDRLIKGWSLNIDKVMDPLCSLNTFVNSCNSQNDDNDENNNLENTTTNNSKNTENYFNLDDILDSVISSIRLISESPNKHFMINCTSFTEDDDTNDSTSNFALINTATANKKISAWCTGYIKVLSRLDAFLRNAQRALNRTNTPMPTSAELALDLCSLLYRIHNNVCYVSPATRALCTRDARDERSTTAASSILVMDYARQSLASWDSAMGIERSNVPYVYPYSRDVLEPLNNNNSSSNSSDNNNNSNSNNGIIVVGSDVEYCGSNNNNSSSNTIVVNDLSTPSPMPDLDGDNNGCNNGSSSGCVRNVDGDDKKVLGRYTKMPSVPPIAIRKPRSLSSSPASPAVVAPETLEFGTPNLRSADLSNSSNGNVNGGDNSAVLSGSGNGGGGGNNSSSSSGHHRSSKHRHHRKDGSVTPSSSHRHSSSVNIGSSTPTASSNNTINTNVSSQKISSSTPTATTSSSTSTTAGVTTPSSPSTLTLKKKKKSKTSFIDAAVGVDKKLIIDEKTPRTPRTPRDFWTYIGPFIGEVLQNSFTLEGPLQMSIATIDCEGDVTFSAQQKFRWLSNRRSIQDLDVYTITSSGGRYKCGVADVDNEPIQLCNVRRIYFGQEANSGNNDEFCGDGRTNIFYLETAKKVYKFAAQSGLEASAWVLGIKRIIAAPEDGVAKHSMSYEVSSTARKREWDMGLRALAEAGKFYSSFDFGLQIDYNFHNRCIAQIQAECDKVDEVLRKINESGDRLVQKHSFYTLRKKGLLENMREHIDKIHSTTALIEARIAATTTTNSQFPSLSSLISTTPPSNTALSSSTSPTSTSPLITTSISSSNTPTSFSTSPTSSIPIVTAAANASNQGISPPSPRATPMHSSPSISPRVSPSTSTSTAEGIVRAVHRLHNFASGNSGASPPGSRWTRPFRKPFFSSFSSSSSSKEQKRDIGAGDWITIGDALREWIDANPEFRLPEYPIAPRQPRRDPFGTPLPLTSSSSSSSSSSSAPSSPNTLCPATPQGFVLSGPEGPGSVELRNGDKVACKSVTCYPLTPATIRELGSVPDGILPNDDELTHMGDPICDQFYVQSTGDNIVAVLADGCNWGSGPRKAAKTAAIALGSFIKMYLGRCTNLSQFSEALILGMEYAAQKVAGGCDRIKPATTTVAGGTVLDISPAGFREKYAWVGVSVGDCKVFHYSARTRIVTDITKNSRFDVNDPSDPGGRIGPYLENGKPDFRNLRICYRRCEKGDLIILATDGVHDNLDPQTLGEEPRNWGLKYDTWDEANEKDPKGTQNAKSQFMVNKLKKVISGSNEINDDNDDGGNEDSENDENEDGDEMPSPLNVVKSLVDNAVKITQSSRKWMNEHPKDKLPSDYVKYPGKLDHVTCVCIRVSSSYSSSE